MAPLAAGGRLLKASVQPGRITFVWERTAGRVGLCPPAVRLTGYPILQITDVPRTSYLQDGGAEGDRTPDLCNAIAALSQLSYGPVPAPLGGSVPLRKSPKTSFRQPNLRQVRFRHFGASGL